MPPADTPPAPDLVEVAGGVIVAYVAKNSVQKADLPALIAIVHAAFAGLGRPPAAEPEKLIPPVPIRKSITPDHLISLEDGRQYRTLKRHLARHGLTSDQYRAKWGLPLDYPTVAPNYSKQRSDLAHKAGLGRKPAEPAKAAAQNRPRGGRKRPQKG